MGGSVSAGFTGFSKARQTIAVLDTGVQSSRPFVSGRVVIWQRNGLVKEVAQRVGSLAAWLAQ
jgi:hypothetical protein